MLDESEFEARRRQSLIIAKRRRFAWIAAPPDLIDQPDLVLAFIADVRERLHPIVFDDLWGNARKFRWTEAGRRRLHAALASGQIDSLSFDGGEASPESTGASIWIKLKRQAGDIPTSAMIDLALLTAAPISTQLVTELTAVVKAWVEPLQAAVAYVSDDPDDSPSVTHHEKVHNLLYPYPWAASNQELRGVFWGTYLGPALCQLLGGSAQVIRDAPTLIRERLGSGVWLQLSEDTPVDDVAYQRLADYLSPILPRGREQQRWYPPAHQRSKPVELPPPVDPPDAPPVPLDVLGLSDSGVDQMLNVVLAPPVDDATLTALQTVMQTWFITGFQGHYGEGALHHISDPSIDRDEGVVRYHVDFGHADPLAAFDALLRWLGSLGEGRVQRLVIGAETVG